jgi:hypothetical protein
MFELHGIIGAELDEPVDPRAQAMAAAIAARHPGARAVIFYGSCLRERRLEGLMLDFYLIVADYRSAYGRPWLAVANRLIPPNVFPFAWEGLNAKYAVLSEADLARECGPDARSASVYARFAQPVRLIWSADHEAKARVVEAVSSAVVTLLGKTSAASVQPVGPLDLWRQAFTFTYGAELRAERSSRPGALIEADPDRYRRVAEAAVPALGALASADRKEAERSWRRLQRRGKLLSVLRLAKASFTFANGIDYLAWKINRHAGTQITVTAWQRRWPLLAALILLPRLLARGAIR